MTKELEQAYKLAAKMKWNDACIHSGARDGGVYTDTEAYRKSIKCYCIITGSDGEADITNAVSTTSNTQGLLNSSDASIPLTQLAESLHWKAY